MPEGWTPIADGHTLFPLALPPPWAVIEKHSDGAAYHNPITALNVICSASMERDSRRWLHVSVSHPDRLPTWDELAEVKSLFIGTERKAIQVLPPTEEHVNVHPTCLHLWACLDGDGLPDFRKLGTL
jgi:hypothetical protein